ncbi:hypothetical protein BC939DRAFT_449497 [Gamsiella multidivaricata]|uniref:uncharacterized protein n=1 Tax=Gamsiella multidivaricata TaxID=101098 RepID=UPI0022206D7B|nr:uncharacterized protein BC939DRAFT_449497 [Gamsiella multidivaricata]KAG0362013.1 hypothetical protein BGZ54_008811 [Gamsiella multidivaricata]KAI7824877.1 hypothetical protein BC939DRAFT_449497 [Gamsiella multidivaricata]
MQRQHCLRRPTTVLSLTLCFFALLVTTPWVHSRSTPFATVSIAYASTVFGPMHAGSTPVVVDVGLKEYDDFMGDDIRTGVVKNERSITGQRQRNRQIRRQVHVPGQGTGVGGDYNKHDPYGR